MSARAPYFKLESFGAVDGPGIRLILFLQGCPYRCVYCHNPESWQIKDLDATISVDELLAKYKANIEFYKKGGITLSGGEPTVHQEFCLELAKKCHAQNISLALDTSGATFIDANLAWYKKIVVYKPLWLIDIKQITPKGHKKVTRTTDELREVNLLEFVDWNKNHSWIRQVLLPDYTDKKEDLIKVGKLIGKMKFVDRFEVLPFHQLAMAKYENLGIDYVLKDNRVPSKEEALDAEKVISEGIKLGKKSAS
ncbi:MAG: 4Fe-4S cluster-binding domain-containing protein [Mycoplasmataceae bacterium]|nr:4Fe-4S cluster-binding domain-containing protein [Mycoplasmataceae bacterium]